MKEHAPRKRRLDLIMVERGLADDREKARVAIMAGDVRVNGELVRVAASTVPEDAAVELVAPKRFVSRGGDKLAHALEAFGIDVGGLVAMDVGASTGGFTDCLLQRGASKVFAIDTGYAQLAYRLRQDKRVISMERTKLDALDKLTPRPDIATIDVSFTGLENVIPSIIRLLKPGGRVVALVKPQFQARRNEVLKGGVVKAPLLHATVIGRVVAWGAEQGLRFGGLAASPLKGPAGNKEFFIYWKAS
jgi:23S rRNA (cytidine1920-2'-O)/16S rRNA (cytidine1409-2'-O)-methyltransferase